MWENFPQPQCWTSEGSLLLGAASGWDSWTFLDLIWSMIGVRLFAQSDIDLYGCKVFFKGLNQIVFMFFQCAFC